MGARGRVRPAADGCRRCAAGRGQRARRHARVPHPRFRGGGRHGGRDGSHRVDVGAVVPVDGARGPAPVPESGRVRRSVANHGRQGRRGAWLRPRRVAARDVECARGAASALRRVQGRAVRPDRPAVPGVLRRGGRAADPARRDRLGRRQTGRDPAASQPEDDRGGRGRVPRGRPHRVRTLGQRRCPRLPEAHPRLARDVRRRGRRRAGRGRVLHALRHRDPVPHRARGGAPRARHQRLPLSLEQADVRPGHPVDVEHDAGYTGGRASGPERESCSTVAAS